MFVQGAFRPVGKALAFIKVMPGDPLDQGLVARRFSVSAHHRGDLGVKNGGRDYPIHLEKNLNILTSGVEHLEHFLVFQNLHEGFEIEIPGQNVDRHRLGG